MSIQLSPPSGIFRSTDVRSKVKCNECDKELAKVSLTNHMKVKHNIVVKARVRSKIVPYTKTKSTVQAASNVGKTIEKDSIEEDVEVEQGDIHEDIDEDVEAENVNVHDGIAEVIEVEQENVQDGTGDDVEAEQGELPDMDDDEELILEMLQLSFLRRTKG